ncbi:lysine N(6)-hydroxylase/L-ornithine N(5)-oxygenase family protein [Plantibacter sp. RU18]|uniref:lysine N(6)-hydroxylase/L-ornithine N(5)-oxygenase family protein n=1 Tax=Plantibacter sp. RU18 TaxID=3158143 RepID=UPI003D36A01E
MTEALDQPYDIIGVGIGPFNLGLACLTEPIAGLRSIYLDQADEFAWHPGMMLDNATLQVPFLADLVTLADPTSRFSYLAWLKEVGRLYPFYIREDFHPFRKEYDAYCKWATRRLASLKWQARVRAVEFDAKTDLFSVQVDTKDGSVMYHTRHLVIGIGTKPTVPPALRDLEGPVIHSAQYVSNRSSLRASGSIAVIGSGQSAAEIYRDLLDSIRDGHYRLDWLTRSPRFFPMDDTKLTLEMTSPEYTSFFYRLTAEVKDRLAREQRHLYKGISNDLISSIYESLYRISVDGPIPTFLQSGVSVTSARWDPARGVYVLMLQQEGSSRTHVREVERVILATGYTPRPPEFLEPIEHLLARDARGQLAVAEDRHIDTLGGRIWVQNAEEHTHGLTAPDLGMGAWRNASLIRSITGREHYSVETRIAFQHFDPSAFLEEAQ